MKKKLISILIAVVFLLNLVVPVFADELSGVDTVEEEIDTQADVQLPNPGILPDSPFYFLDKLAEKVIIMFSFSPDKKAARLLKDADERLAEADALAAEGNQDLATQTAQIYLNTIEAAQVQITISANGGKVSGTVYNDVYSLVTDKKSKSVVAVVYGLDLSQRKAAVVLLQVLAKAPEKARKGLLNAFENVVKHQLEKNANILVVTDGKTVSMAVYNSGQIKKHQGQIPPEKPESDEKQDRDKAKDDHSSKDGANNTAPGQQKAKEQDKHQDKEGKSRGWEEKGRGKKTPSNSDGANAQETKQTPGNKPDDNDD